MALLAADRSAMLRWVGCELSDRRSNKSVVSWWSRSPCVGSMRSFFSEGAGVCARNLRGVGP